MSTTVLVAIIGGLATTMAAIGTYLGVARKLSGKIETSAAEELWEESRQIRIEYREQIKALRERLTEVESSVGDLSKSNAKLQTENERLSREIERLVHHNERLEADNKKLRVRITQLEKGESDA